MFVAGFDADVNALGGVATSGGTIVLIEKAQEIGEGFDISVFGFLIANLFGFSFGIIVFHAEDSAILVERISNFMPGRDFFSIAQIFDSLQIKFTIRQVGDFLARGSHVRIFPILSFCRKNGRWHLPSSFSFFQKHIENLIDPVRPIG